MLNSLRHENAMLCCEETPAMLLKEEEKTRENAIQCCDGQSKRAYADQQLFS
jgi:hypothetical protein